MFFSNVKAAKRKAHRAASHQPGKSKQQRLSPIRKEGKITKHTRSLWIERTKRNYGHDILMHSYFPWNKRIPKYIKVHEWSRSGSCVVVCAQLRGSSSGGKPYWLELRGGIHLKKKGRTEEGREESIGGSRRSGIKKRTYVLYLGGWVCDVILQPAPGAVQAPSKARLFLSLL